MGISIETCRAECTKECKYCAKSKGIEIFEVTYGNLRSARLMSYFHSFVISLYLFLRRIPLPSIFYSCYYQMSIQQT